jgi:hypothetical protein
MKHQLLPRSKGLQFCLQNLKDSTEWLYDCTIGYEGIPPGQFGQDIFTLRSSMFEGRPPKSVNMHFRRFKIADIPIQNEKSFDVWLRNRWREKDYLLEHFAQYNRFPEDDKWLIKQRQTGKKGPVPAKSIETQIKSNSLEEFLSIFAPLSSVMTVLFLFYGGGKPEDMLKMIGDAAQHHQKIALERDDESQSEPLKLKKVPASTTGMSGISKVRKAPSSITPAKAQRNLVQQYVTAIRPAAAGQISLPDRALRISNVAKGDSSLRSNRKPGNQVQKSPLPQKAATTAPEGTRNLQKQPLTNSKRAASLAAAPTTKAVAAKPTAVAAKAPAPRPPNGRRFSNTSTVKPGDSISAVNAPTKQMPERQKIKPNTVKDKNPTKKANQSTATSSQNSTVKPAKNVSIDPAMLMRMKAGKKDTQPKRVHIDPQTLAKMKASKS